jgi:para-aminobenzoate synthetase component I
VPALPRPVVLLEDGLGRTGRARLAWGVRARHRLPWSVGAAGRLDWLAELPADRRVYGVIAYDLGLPPRARRASPALSQPLADFFEPEHELVADLATGTVEHGAVDQLREATAEAGARRRDGEVALPRLVDRSFDERGFGGAVARIKQHIVAGDVYQVNLTLAERFEAVGSAWAAYRRLRDINPSPWMGFADFGDWQIVSGSPELLVDVQAGGRVRTRPIAGTRKKTGDPTRDATMRAELRLDEKEQAEHRMLVDLARNDVGRVAEFGSVRVTEREVVEEYSHVFHLVSEVGGTLRGGLGPYDAVTALFPGGTITGAPKIRAMEVIADLEPVARGAYTGGLGWFGVGEGQLNILIRSAVFREGVACVQAGAGIVWDSDPTREWRESLRKGAAMRAALGMGA